MSNDNVMQQNKQQIVQLYGAITVSVLIVFGFILELYLAYMHDDQHTKDTIANLINNAVMIVLGYWVGSSMSSQKKDTMLMNALPPPPVDDGEKLPPPPKAV